MLFTYNEVIVMTSGGTCLWLVSARAMPWTADVHMIGQMLELFSLEIVFALDHDILGVSALSLVAITISA